ncbi:hypothetical protein LTR56_004408 [Elasticomyces elasticus]|nr:hypothetical protein LTR22_025947 [Elasticomyces elasticus]KAK3653554.1 hypothetical protein LTR56_004408 [Elasticomyces elasticus]KAK4916546.1 hypothetical protein LTR49_015514 [Elasticomyces elasticus]KAK5755802.1 hypothetical protein LTS12_014155 [Elasticomyces elasticus]
MSTATYRLEIAKGGQAGCQATQCKTAGTKIAKGEVRQGVLVTIKEHTSWKWRHWGCITPQVIANWMEVSQGDMDLVDGYDTLPDEVQAKVRRAFEQGHIDDDDWNGDVEMNRPGAGTGMHKKTKEAPKKKAKKDGDEGDEELNSTPVKPKKATKKRGRSKEDEDDEDVDEEPKPAAKRSKAKKAAVVKDEDEEPEAAPAVKKPKKSAKAKADADDDGAAAKPAAKKAKGKKAPVSTEMIDNSDDDAEATAPAVKAVSEKAAQVDNDEDDAGADKVKPQKAKAKPKGKGKGKKAAVVDED